MDKKDKKDLEKSLAQMKNTKEELKKFISSYGVGLKKRIGSFLVAKQTKHLDDFSNLCKAKKFDVDWSEVEQLESYTALLKITNPESQEYVTDNIRRFYTEFIESFKDELYA